MNTRSLSPYTTALRAKGLWGCGRKIPQKEWQMEMRWLAMRHACFLQKHSWGKSFPNQETRDDIYMGKIDRGKARQWTPGFHSRDQNCKKKGSCNPFLPHPLQFPLHNSLNFPRDIITNWNNIKCYRINPVLRCSTSRSTIYKVLFKSKKMSLFLEEKHE